MYIHVTPAHEPRARERRGSTTIIVACMVTTVAVLVLIMLTAVVDTSDWTKARVDSFRVDAAADSATTLAANELWSEFEVAMGGQSAKTWDFRNFMEAKGFTDQKQAAKPAAIDYRSLTHLPKNPDGDIVIDGALIERLDVYRVDELNTTRLVVTATATAGSGDPGNGQRGYSKTVRQVFAIEPPDWDGLSYALLANNINCVMCHLEVDNVNRVYNDDPERRGEFKRVKLGSIESFHLRDDPESWIAGTLHLGGQALQSDGQMITSWSSLAFKSREFDTAGYLVEDSWGELAPTNLAPADPLTPTPMENLYLDYIVGNASSQSDGYLPETFPSPFPDNGGYDFDAMSATPEYADNRVLDANEFAAATHGADGSITGGTISLVAPGTQLSGAADVAALTAGNAAQLAAVSEGHVYLHGTVDDPIVLNGEIAINGDLIISGVVKGSGSLKVSGNVYMPSDVLYADGTSALGGRTFGVAADGVTNELAVASGGNVMIGDFMHPKWGQGDAPTGYANGSWSFILDELSIFNRMEWMKTQATLPGKPVNQVVGTKEEAIYAWVLTGETYEKEIYVWTPTGETYEQDVYGWVPTGVMLEEPVYGWILDPAYPPEYAPKIKVQTGTKEVPEMEKVVTGTKTVVVKEKVLVGTKTIEVKAKVQTGTKTVDITAWVTPQFPNPYYAGAGYTPRYYNFTEGGDVPVFNKDGHFDPGAGLWLGAERPDSWSTSKLTLADPGDTSDDILYDGGGAPKAVVSSLTPTGGWLGADDLRSLIHAQLGARDANEPLEVNATVYSNNSIFGLVPGESSNGVGVNGQLRINGAVVAADVGLLAPAGALLNFDERGKGLLGLSSADRLAIRRSLWMPASH